MIQTKTTKDYHRQIDKFIERHTKHDYYENFINEFVKLLEEIETTYTTHGRVILNYLLSKLDKNIGFKIVYRILIELCVVKYDVINFSRITLRLYTIEYIRNIIEPLYGILLSDILKHTNKEYLKVDDILGSEYTEALALYFKRKSYIVLSKSNSVNFRRMVEDVTYKINKKKTKFINTESQMVLFADNMNVVDDKIYKDLILTFKPDYGMEAFISECLYSAVDIEGESMDFSITWYDKYLSPKLINEFNEFILLVRENIFNAVDEEKGFVREVVSMLNRIVKELRSQFKITFSIDPRRGDFINENMSYRRIRSAIIVNYLLVEITDLIIRNLLSTMHKSKILYLVSEINDLIDTHTGILNIFEGEVTDEYYSEFI